MPTSVENRDRNARDRKRFAREQKAKVSLAWSGAGNASGMTRVLIAVDGTDSGVEVARRARQLFGDEAEYLAMNCGEVVLAVPFGMVYPMAEMGYGFGTQPLGMLNDQASSEAISAATHRAEHVASDAGLTDVIAVGEIGDPVVAIVRAADEHCADVIVVGSRRHSWLSGLFDASVSEGVRKKAHVPVLFVKEADTVKEADPEGQGHVT